jgi:hypothetical protein
MIFQVLNEDGTAYNPLERLSPLTLEQEERIREIIKEELKTAIEDKVLIIDYDEREFDEEKKKGEAFIDYEKLWMDVEKSLEGHVGIFESDHIRNEVMQKWTS